jgi:hypothetical protein
LSASPLRLDDLVDDCRAQRVEFLRRGIVVIGRVIVAVLGDEREHEGLERAKAGKRTGDEVAGLAPALGERLVLHHLGRMTHITDPGMERLVLLVFQALEDQGRALRGDSADAFEDQPRFADTGLALDQHCPAASRRGMGAADIERIQFAAAAHEWCQMLAALGKTEFDRLGLAHQPDPLRLGEAFEHVAAGVTEGKIVLGQAIGRIVHADRARWRERLDAGRQMQRRTHGEGIGHIVVPPDRAVDDEPGGDADAHRDAAGLGETRLAEGGDDGSPAGNGFLGVTAERARRAEIGGEPVAGMMGEDATMTLDDGFGRFVEDSQEGFEILRIHRIRVLRRIDDIAGENGEVTSLARHCCATLVEQDMPVIYRPARSKSPDCAGGGHHGAMQLPRRY